MAKRPVKYRARVALRRMVDMAAKNQVTVKVKHCELIHLDVEIKEQRVYPSTDFLQTQGYNYQVRACTCSAAIDCNLAGIPCQWALNSPATDRS